MERFRCNGKERRSAAQVAMLAFISMASAPQLYQNE
jgi:hypothetical protein